MTIKKGCRLNHVNNFNHLCTTLFEQNRCGLIKHDKGCGRRIIIDTNVQQESEL